MSKIRDILFDIALIIGERFGYEKRQSRCKEGSDKYKEYQKQIEECDKALTGLGIIYEKKSKECDD